MSLFLTFYQTGHWKSNPGKVLAAHYFIGVERSHTGILGSLLEFLVQMFTFQYPIKLLTKTQTHIVYAIFDQNKEKSICFNHFCVYSATCIVFKYCTEILMI